MRCDLCERENVQITKHHLIPRARHANKKIRKEFDRAQRLITIAMCQHCHKQIHALFSEKKLSRKYFTLETLKDDPKIKEFIVWIAKRPADFKLRIKRSW